MKLQQTLKLAGISQYICEMDQSDKEAIEYFTQNDPEFEDISDLPEQIRAKVVKARNDSRIKKISSIIVKSLEDNNESNIEKALDSILSHWGANVQTHSTSGMKTAKENGKFYTIQINGYLDIVYEIMMAIEGNIRQLNHTCDFSNEKLKTLGNNKYAITFAIRHKQG